MNNDQTTHKYEHYYVPEQSKWPIIAASSIFVLLLGAALVINSTEAGISKDVGWFLLLSGVIAIIWMMFGWFSNVIEESHADLYSKQMDRTFRWGMFWFIFSEVMLFVTFFGALFYTRVLSVPELAGLAEQSTHYLLWPKFNLQWPLLVNPDNKLFVGAKDFINPYHLPLLNTILLLSSSVTLTIAHNNLRIQNRGVTISWLAATILLGALFLVFQVMEYLEAYRELGLTLSSGIYGSTFFLLTGLHGAHVTLGAIMIAIMLARVKKGHFAGENHFGFEATCWYWHFVDVVWVGLFIFVYIM